MFFRVSNGAGVKPQGTATPEDVLANKTFSNDTGVGVPGTMVNNTGWTGEGTPTGNNQVDVTIPKGYHDGTGKVVCKGQTAYAAGVSNGQSAARIGTAGAGDVLAGKTFTNASASGISGSMVNRGAWSTNATANGAVTIPAGYHNGGGRVNVNVHDDIREITFDKTDTDHSTDMVYFKLQPYIPSGYRYLGVKRLVAAPVSDSKYMDSVQISTDPGSTNEYDVIVLKHSKAQDTVIRGTLLVIKN